MPRISWLVSVIVDDTVSTVYDAGSDEAVDVSQKSAEEVIAMLESGDYLLRLSDHYSAMNSIEHTDFFDVDGLHEDLEKMRS